VNPDSLREQVVFWRAAAVCAGNTGRNAARGKGKAAAGTTGIMIGKIRIKYAKKKTGPRKPPSFSFFIPAAFVSPARDIGQLF